MFSSPQIRYSKQTTFKVSFTFPRKQNSLSPQNMEVNTFLLKLLHFKAKKEENLQTDLFEVGYFRENVSQIN